MSSPLLIPLKYFLIALDFLVSTSLAFCTGWFVYAPCYWREELLLEENTDLTTKSPSTYTLYYSRLFSTDHRYHVWLVGYFLKNGRRPQAAFGARS